MKTFVLFIFPALIFLSTFAQNKPYDFKAFTTWPIMNPELLSGDGRYLSFTVFRRLSGNSTTIKSLDHSFVREISDASNAQFTPDSKHFLCMENGNTLHIWNLKERKEKVFAGITDYQIPTGGEGRWLGYTSSNRDLTVMDLTMDTTILFHDVLDFKFSRTGKVLLINIASKDSSDKDGVLLRLNLLNGSVSKIWKGEGAEGFVFDPAENNVAFLTNGSNRSLWITSGDTVKRLVPGEFSDGDRYFELNSRELEFSPDGRKLFFAVTKRADPVASQAGAAAVHIWRYNDPFLKELQGWHEDVSKIVVRAVVNLDDQKVLVLAKELNFLWRAAFGQLNKSANDNYLLVIKGLNLAERDLHKEQLSDVYLCKTDDGHWDTVASKVYSDGIAKFSPAGKYVFWYDPRLKQYVIYNIRRKSTKLIDKSFPAQIYWEVWDQKMPPIAHGVAGWSSDDRYIFIYDRYDIWKVDPEQREAPVNITSGYGRKHKVVLRLVKPDDGYGLGTTLKDSSLLLCALDERTKANGFYKLRPGGSRQPVCLRMMDSLLYFPLPEHYTNDFLKSDRGDVFLLKAESAGVCPNLVCTNDFIHFDPVTDLAPQAGYNWLKSELLFYKTMEGHDGEGILYKPADFDPHKKYPVILFFYERMTGGLNVFRRPELSNGAINIPWFVSRGYLVFCPDIHFKIGFPGKGIYDYVVSAAKYLQKMPWVDSSAIGIQSHSFGGFEVNYLVTHTHLFAAAAAGASSCDLLSQYDELAGGAVRQDFLEYNQYRLGSSPWQNMAAYIDNSPIFRADKVSTPLLMLNNKDDGAVPVEQGFEFFLALRRLGKPVWLLQYDGGGHYVNGDENQADYTQRLEDFFDCYLKKKPMPKWMMEAVK